VEQLRKDAQKAVQDVMGKYKVDAIAILSDSPLASVAAAAGKSPRINLVTLCLFDVQAIPSGQCRLDV
jgi:hypothetical protein